MAAAGYRNAEVQKFVNKSIGGTGFQISTKTLRPGTASRRCTRRSTRSSATAPSAGHEELLLDLDRADVRQNGRQQRGHRDHRLAAGDLGLHRAALRVEVRGPGADRADARPADHGRRVLADGPGSDDRDGRGAADDPRVFALRHDHRVRPRARERAANAARRVLADRQPLDVRGADAIAGDELLHAAAGPRAAAVRRRNAQGLRVRADGRHRLRRLLVDLHRLAGADALEGARGRLPRPPRADRARTRRRAGLRDDGGRRARGRRAGGRSAGARAAAA